MRDLSDAMFVVDMSDKLAEMNNLMLKGFRKEELNSKPDSWWRSRAAVRSHIPEPHILATRIQAVLDKYGEALDACTGVYLTTGVPVRLKPRTRHNSNSSKTGSLVVSTDFLVTHVRHNIL